MRGRERRELCGLFQRVNVRVRTDRQADLAMTAGPAHQRAMGGDHGEAVRRRRRLPPPFGWWKQDGSY